MRLVNAQNICSLAIVVFNYYLNVLLILIAFALPSFILIQDLNRTPI